MNRSRALLFIIVIASFLWVAVATSFAQINRYRVLNVLGDTNTPSAADSTITSRLGALGFDVVTLDDDVVTTDDAQDVSLVLIQESVSSGAVAGKFKDVSLPVISMEPWAWDDDCYVGIDGGADVDWGASPGNPEHTILIYEENELSAGFVGGTPVNFYTGTDTSRNKLNWGVPGEEAIVVATLPDDESKAVYFAYDTGAAMPQGFTAPDKRVALWLQNGVADSTSGDAWKLVYNAIDWCMSGQRDEPILSLLYVTAAQGWGMWASDPLLWVRFKNMGIAVTNFDAPSVTSDEADFVDFVYVSSTVGSGDVGGKFLESTVPVFVQEPYIQDDMMMTGPAADVDYRFIEDITRGGSGMMDITIVDESHPLAAGLSGIVSTLSSYDVRGAWGAPSENADVVAKFVLHDGSPDTLSQRVAIYGYDIGSEMYNGYVAPERRVGFCWLDDAPDYGTEDGWKLWDAAIDWLNYGLLSGVESAINSPENFVLYQNYPNPFNPRTTISYSVVRPGFVSIKVFDLLGREVRTLVEEAQPSGTHTLVFDAADLPSNIYFYRLEMEGFSEIRKMALVR